MISQDFIKILQISKGISTSYIHRNKTFGNVVLHHTNTIFAKKLHTGERNSVFSFSTDESQTPRLVWNIILSLLYFVLLFLSLCIYVYI